MFGLFKKDPVKQLEKKYYALLEEAKTVQRSGDIKKYAQLMTESEEIWKEIESLREKKQ